MRPMPLKVANNGAPSSGAPEACPHVSAGPVFAALAALFTLIALSRYAAWHTCTLDMAYYVRLVWGLGQGDPTQPVIDAPHWLGLHFEPVLLPLAALSRLGVPAAPLLLVVQALAGAAALFPAVALARRHVPEHALSVALCVFLVPAFGRNLDFDFHPNTMAVWPLLAFVERLDAGRPGRACAWLLLAATCREDVALQGALAALLAPGLPRGWRVGFTLGGLLGFAAWAGLVQPAFLHGHARSSFAQHFGMLGLPAGGGVPGLIRIMLNDPFAVAGHLLTPDRLLYPLLLLASVGFLPLRAPRWLGGALPVVGVNLLSGFDGVRNLQSHYLTSAVPFLFAAAVIGAGQPGRGLGARLDHRLRPFRRILPATATSLLLTLDPTPWARVRQWFPDDDTVAAQAAAARIPPDAALVAPSELLAHLAERPRVHHRWFVPEPTPGDLWRIVEAPCPNARPGAAASGCFGVVPPATGPQAEATDAANPGPGP